MLEKCLVFYEKIHFPELMLRFSNISRFENRMLLRVRQLLEKTYHFGFAMKSNFILSHSLIPIFEVDLMFASEVSSKVNTVKINRKRFKFAFAPRVLFMRESGAALPNYGRLMRF